MISFTKAQRLLSDLEVDREVESIPVEDATGRVLARTIDAREDVPGFRKSAMDGYAVHSADLSDASEDDPVELTEAGTAGAGHPVSDPLDRGETVRIFTGAPVPSEADAVVMQERVERTGPDTVRFTEPVRRSNIRQQGEELKQGDLLLEEQTELTPAGVGLLAEQGYTGIPVVRHPSVAAVNTGDELVAPDEQPAAGQVRDSIGPALSAALDNEGIRPVRRRVEDDRGKLARVLEELVTDHDLVLVSGGVSVGDRDLTPEVLEEIGVEPIFWKVRQKPGKPLYLGRRNGTFVIGLPGNPVSSLVCYYLYGRPLVRNMSGFPEGRRRLPAVPTSLENGDESRPARTVFVRARTFMGENGFKSEPLEHQGSHMLSGLARANSLVRLPPEENEGQDRVRAYLLPERNSDVFS